MIHTLHTIVREAGRRILEYYVDQPGSIEYKADASPLTEADKVSHAYILEQLEHHFPSIPVLSEESASEVYVERSGWRYFWLVDPLDGTKEFIKRTGEFTVNIALIEEGCPVGGIVYVPIHDIAYVGERGRGAFRMEGGDIHPIRTRSWKWPLEIVASQDHRGPGIRRLLERLPEARVKHMGSARKFCLVAEGAADLYYRDTPTMEWDTAAAQCVVEAAGGQVLTLEGEPLRYNKQELHNPPLVTVGDPSLPWQEWIRD